MRKFVWGIGACGVFVLGATLWSSSYAARHPHSFVGKVMHGASRQAGLFSPAAGFGPVVAALRSKPVADDEVQGIPDDPVPLEANVLMGDKPQLTTSAPIVIPEDDAMPNVAAAAIKPVQHEVAVDGSDYGVEFQTQAVSVLRAPAVMPFCRDEEECEILPEPCVEAIDEEEQDATGATDPAKATKTEDVAKEPMPVDQCREDPHHHYHHSVCPHTGRGYPCPATGSKPTCDPPKPHESKYQTPGGEEDSEPTKAEETGKALKKVKRIKSREAIDVGCPTFPKFPSIDTMEMRSSDKQLYDYGPGSL